MRTLLSKLSRADRAEVIEAIAAEADSKITSDPEGAVIVDEIIRTCGLQPTPQLHRLVLLSLVLYDIGNKAAAT